jgi:hypothetical protein
MDMKTMYLQAMTSDNGRHSEMELGESLGLNADETSKIISRLLDEHKIEFVINGTCSYKPYKSKTK